MKLLLTSNGLSNSSIANALEGLVRKPRKDTKVAFIPTAAFPVDDNKHDTKNWLIDDLHKIKEFAGFVDLVSLADLTKEEIIERLEYVDVIFVGGGNTFYLSYWMEKSGLFEALPRLLESRVYAGISAGSMIATQSLRTASQAIKYPGRFYDQDYDELGPKGRSAGMTAKLVDFVVRPHLYSVNFPQIQGGYLEEMVKDLQWPLYAIDDNSAVRVNGHQVDVVSEGEWKRLEPAR